MKILSILRRMSLPQYQLLLNSKYYSTMLHMRSPTHNLCNGNQNFFRNPLPHLLSFLENRMLQQNYQINTITACDALTDSQATNIRLAKSLVTHIYDQAAIENTTDTKEARDRQNKFRQLTSNARDLDSAVEEISELLQIINNSKTGESELVEMATQDLSSCLANFDHQFCETAIRLLPDNALDARSAVLEVQAGAGGNEASLFAQEIFDLYVGYSEQNFEIEITEIEAHNGKFIDIGIDKAKAIVNGFGAFRFLKYECGVHRVQRFPQASTGNQANRLQTSTCSVAVLPIPDETDHSIPEKELDIKFTRSSGPGGQNVNKLDTACQMTHIPTGFSVKCQEFRTQHQNKAKALKQVY